MSEIEKLNAQFIELKANVERLLMYYEEMRYAQKKYFKTKDKYNLGISKLREEALDKRVKDLKAKYFTTNLFN